jgi:transketolase
MAKNIYLQPKSRKNNLASTRDGFGQGLIKAASSNKKIVALTGDLRESLRLEEFAQKYPDRFFECGVAEQNMIGISAGLAHEGFIPFACSYGVFSAGRGWEQIRLAVSYSKNNVKIVGSHAGIATGEDGVSHQATEDIALTRVLPNFVVLSPCDVTEAEKATVAAANWQGPVYLRLVRPKTPSITMPSAPFEIGKMQILREGSDVTIIATGPLLYFALLAGEKLSQNQIEVEVINCSTIKPLDEKTLLQSVLKTKALVTVEDHQLAGGMGSAIAEFLVQNKPVPQEFVAMRDCYASSGESRELWQEYHLCDNDIIEAVKRALKRKH